MIEKILKEINRLKNELDGYSALEALDYIEAYINTLLEEPASEDLEEAANEFGVRQGVELKPFAIKFFKAGAEWQKHQMKETLQTEYEKGLYDMREEIMKDAVDATIFSELKDIDGSLFQAKSDRFRMNGVKISDIIKVIPIKPEQQ